MAPVLRMIANDGCDPATLRLWWHRNHFVWILSDRYPRPGKDLPGNGKSFLTDKEKFHYNWAGSKRFKYTGLTPCIQDVNRPVTRLRVGFAG